MFILIRFLFISALIIILSDCTIALFNTFVIEREKIFSFTKTSSSLMISRLISCFVKCISFLIFIIASIGLIVDLSFDSFIAINESKDKSTINPIEAIINIKNDIHFTKHEINLEIINDEEVFVNENIFSRSITNVLNNAIVQSDKIIIKADINKNLIKINIHDNGIGIPDSEKDNVFKPFYRVDQSRNQNVSNSGLGLATTKSLLNSINGKISLHDSYLGGLEVAIEIPN